MKNRIWKQIKQITVAAAVAGTVLFGSVQPGMAADSELQSGQELSDDREKEDGYEHMEELASGETVCKENEAPEEESESTQERTETGGENVESAALPLEGVEEEDMDMEEDMSEDTEDAEEPEEMPEEEPEEISPSADADTEKADMTLSLTSETEEMKAGKTIRYRVDLANTGDVDLIDIQMTSSFSCPKITQQWEEAEGLDGEGADAEVAELKAGEKRSFIFWHRF